MTSLTRHILEQIVALSSEGVLVADAQSADMPVVYINSAYERLTGYAASELVGNPWRLLERGPDDSPELNQVRTAVGRGEPCAVVTPKLRKDGTAWLSQLRVMPLYNGPGDVRYFLCLQRPATKNEQGDSATAIGLLQRELGRARQKIVNLNRIDPVSGLLRFDYFLELARRDVRMAARDERPLAVLLFEIVELDVYRQTFGDKAADSCLRMVGAQVSGTLKRAGDLSARRGEAAIVALVHQDAEQAQRLAARIADNVRGLGLHNPRARSGRYVGVRTKVWCDVPEGRDEPEALIERLERDDNDSRPFPTRATNKAL